MNRLKTFFELLKQTFTEWNEDHAPRLAAALSYYIAFSIAPLLVVIIGIVGIIVSQDTVQNQIITEVQRSLGSDAAQMIGELIANASKPAEGLLATILGLVTLLLGAGGVFGQMQDALNTIWDVDPASTGKQNTGVIFQIQNKFLSFGMVLVLGFLLLVSLVINTVIAAVSTYFVNMLPGVEFLISLLNLVISFVVISAMFALIYKFLPKVKLEWRDVIVGGAMTSALFAIGRFLLGWYLGRSSTASAYGAAGSFVLILVWIYYTAQIVLFGAEFTQVYARRYGSLKHTKVVPTAATTPPPTINGPASVQPGTQPAPPLALPPHTIPPARGSALSGIVFTVGVFLVAAIAGLFNRGSGDTAN
ncbi:MAG: YihY/virulence factor BrkB family protein [Chloroflexi bacterium]|nr:YihY/virulence factor BrkB family protein [Chloroflexota bacterium]MCC6893321.1 YihY/virulence factor BrkB family protein [Anaerolineae bacterium]